MAKVKQENKGSVRDMIGRDKITNIFKSENRGTLYIILVVVVVTLGFVVYTFFNEKEQDLKELDDLKRLQNELAESRDLEKTFTENGNTEKRQIYTMKCDSLETEIDKLEKTIERVFKTLSEIPIYGELYNKVKPYIDRGEFRKASNMLKNADLDLSTKRAKKQRQRSLEMWEEADKALKSNSYLYLIQAELWQTFYSEPNWFEKTISFYEKSLDASRTPETVHNYAAFLHHHNKFKRSRILYEENLALLRFLALKNPDTYLPNVAGTLNNLANLHKVENRLSEALEMYQEALRIRKKLADKNPDTYLPFVATTALNLSIFYQEGEPNPSKSIALAKEVLEIAEKFPQVPSVQSNANKARRVLQAWKGR